MAHQYVAAPPERTRESSAPPDAARPGVYWYFMDGNLDRGEMGAQNWTPKFRAEFRQRRGYDPLPYFVTLSGRAVTRPAVSERFPWDVRLTAQELVLENYAGHLKSLGRRHGFTLSIEPYDMNPTADLDLGAVADVPMGEFWSAGYGFDSSFSGIEATSMAHTMGKAVVSAEAFTAEGSEGWQQFPGSMKNQGDWALGMGINRFVYHTFAHKPLGDADRPGMTMGPYGVHWDRGQTWWPMAEPYHRYVTRCSHLLRQGATVSDILYLTPEGAPVLAGDHFPTIDTAEIGPLLHSGTNTIDVTAHNHPSESRNPAGPARPASTLSPTPRTHKWTPNARSGCGTARRSCGTR